MRANSQFFRSLASFHRAGVSWAVALKQVAGNDSQLQDASSTVAGGELLSDALADHVSPLDRALIRAGEASGSLETRLSMIADRHDANTSHRRQEQAALAYPLFLMHVVALLLVAFNVITGHAVRGILMAACVLGPLYVWFALRARANRAYSRGSTAVDTPSVWFGNRNQVEARDAMAYEALGDLLEGGVPLDEALQLSARAGAGGRVAVDLHTARRQLPTGRKLGESWETIPDDHAHALRLAEHAGDLPQTSKRLAIELQEVVRLRRAKTRSMLPVILILFVGAIVAYTVISYYSGLLNFGRYNRLK